MKNNKYKLLEFPGGEIVAEKCAGLWYAKYMGTLIASPTINDLKKSVIKITAHLQKKYN